MWKCQTIVGRGASYLSIVGNRLDKIVGKEYTESKAELKGILDDCVDSIALFDHSNKEIYLFRREPMKPDVTCE